MSDQLRESVSALVDGETSELELRRLLAENNSETVRTSWTSYHRIRDVMAGSDTASSTYRNLDISARVSAAIADEPVLAASSKPSANWWRPVTSFAVAASVAAAVVVGIRGANPLDPLQQVGPAVEQSVAVNRVYLPQNAPAFTGQNRAGGGVVVNSVASTNGPGGLAASRAAADLEAQKRLDQYLLRHTERAALNNGQGIISYARVASFTTTDE